LLASGAGADIRRLGYPRISSGGRSALRSLAASNPSEANKAKACSAIAAFTAISSDEGT